MWILLPCLNLEIRPCLLLELLRLCLGIWGDLVLDTMVWLPIRSSDEFIDGDIITSIIWLFFAVWSPYSYYPNQNFYFGVWNSLCPLYDIPDPDFFKGGKCLPESLFYVRAAKLPFVKHKVSEPQSFFGFQFVNFISNWISAKYCRF